MIPTVEKSKKIITNSGTLKTRKSIFLTCDLIVLIVRYVYFLLYIDWYTFPLYCSVVRVRNDACKSHRTYNIVLL